MNTEKISERIAPKVVEFINNAVDPMDLLKSLVSLYGKPIICQNKTMFNPEPDCVWRTFEVFLDYTKNAIGELMLCQVNDKGEIFTCTAHDYILSMGGTDSDKGRRFAEIFAEHFFKTIGYDYAKAKREALVGVYKNLIMDMDSSIGTYVFGDYDVQCAIQDHRMWCEDEDDE